jgi:hypothetical protein
VAYLVDTSLLARLANTADAFHGTAAWLAMEMHRLGDMLNVTRQNLAEYRSVAIGQRYRDLDGPSSRAIMPRDFHSLLGSSSADSPKYSSDRKPVQDNRPRALDTDGD